MPYAGEIKHGRDIGKIEGHNSNKKYIWRVCLSCGEGMWDAIVKGKPQRETCRKCYLNHTYGWKRLAEHSCWKGGRLTREGYVLLRLDDDSPYRSMADCKGYIREHRLVMAEKLGRLLSSKEIVHHIDGNKSNNEESNLELISWANHTLYKKMCKDCPLRKKVKQLTKIIEALKPKLSSDDGG